MILLLLTVGLFCLQSALAQESSTPAPPIPKRSGQLNDQAKVLNLSEAQVLEAYLQQIRQQTGVEIYILTVIATKPTDIVTYSHQVADAWGLKADAPTDKWIFIVVAVNDGGINIADSPAVRAIMPDTELDLIMERQMKPAFNAGRFARGLGTAVQQINQQLVLAVPKDLGTSNSNEAARRSELLLFALVGVLVVGLYYFFVIRHH
jgi:uncharacterized protein